MNAKVIVSARRYVGFDITKHGLIFIREDKLKEVASQSRGDHEPFVLPLDMIDLASHKAAHDAIIEKYGKIDIVVLNAGRSQRNAAMDTKFEDTTGLMELNFESCVHLAQIVLPQMIASGSGQVLSYLLVIISISADGFHT
jgi:dehydrogenase/reductase SDR family member 7B